MPLDAGTMVLYTIGFFLLYLLCWFFIKPLKWLLGLLGVGVWGGLAIFLWNLIGTRMGMGLNLNPLTAMFAGVLGVPGMILTGVLSRFL